jgi:mRNA-degrading endonuclease toxin of MazEF toxin-antitoxin module
MPDRQAGRGVAPRRKYVVVLQGGPRFDNAMDRAVVVCSSLRADPSRLRPFEVLVGQSEGFDHDTVIDCRWVYTVTKASLGSTRYTRLSLARMNEISAALVVGLQM